MKRRSSKNSGPGKRSNPRGDSKGHGKSRGTDKSAGQGASRDEPVRKKPQSGQENSKRFGRRKQGDKSVQASEAGSQGSGRDKDAGKKHRRGTTGNQGTDSRETGGKKRDAGNESSQGSRSAKAGKKGRLKTPQKGGSQESETREGIRLNKFIADAGICSRRDADKLIEQGEIYVNGKVVTQLGVKVARTDKVTYKGKKLVPEKLIYVLLNKPKDFITTTDDPGDRRTVMDLVKNACEERIYPVGRLDRQTTGLLLLTNDGELAKALAHPSHNVRKIYKAELDQPLTRAHFDQIKEGVELEDGKAPVDELAILTPDMKTIGLELHIGRNRIVRRIFESLGYEVIKLDRVMYAGLDKQRLSRGKWRMLTEKEVLRLKRYQK